ncbi:MAG: hypothetical protein RIR62_531, partial [Pseudomonadota bacterium]
MRGARMTGVPSVAGRGRGAVCPPAPVPGAPPRGYLSEGDGGVR